MKKLKEVFKSPHVQIALATGVCIIAMAFASKRILPEPIGYIPLAIPPFLMTIYECVLNRYKDSKVITTWYWIAAIFLTTALIIFYYWIK
jgi:predicted histidine transporter YuiF (NhaC family)